MNKGRKGIYSILLTVLSVGLCLSCASIGNPSGGPRDEDPPYPVRSNPLPGSVNFDKRRVVIEFNELVNVKDAFSNVTISPTSKEIPRVSTAGRRVIVNFNDTLAANTTYTIDFGNAIEDLNEGNKLQSYSFTFSTGPEIDTLRIAGVLLDSRTLEPQQNVLVGIHSNLEDTAFSKLPLERISKTNDRGQFVIHGLKAGEYRLFALGDLNNDYRWDNPEESLAFYDVVLSPTTTSESYTDSVKNKETGELDSVVQRNRVKYLPDDILLSYFNSGYKPLYIKDYARKDSAKIELQLSTKSPVTPEVKVVGMQESEDWSILERSVTNDTLTYWLTSPELIARDTIFLSVKYLRNDNNGDFEEVTDTMRFLKPKVRPAPKPKKKKGEAEEDLTKYVEVKFTGGGTHDIGVPLYIEFDVPIDTLYKERFHLEQKIDTTWVAITDDFDIERLDSINPRRFKVDRKWDYGASYKLTLDSLPVRGIYGEPSKGGMVEFKIKEQSDYSNLKLNIVGLPAEMPAFVELLRSDNPVKMAKVTNGAAMFLNVDPGDYYARIVLDANDNGEYDYGDYRELRQPEVTAYYDKVLKLKKNWDVEQTWDIFAIPVDKQKPAKIRKNKYDSEKRRGTSIYGEGEDDEDEEFDVNRNPFDNKRNNNNNNRGGGLNGPMRGVSTTA